MSIHAIIFDIGGVLVRTEDRAPRQALASRLGTSDRALEELVFGGEMGRRAQLGQISTEEQWVYACQQTGLPTEQWQALRQEFFAGDRLDAELMAFIRTLRPIYKTGIISNGMADARPLIEGAWGMADAFDVIVLSCEVGVMKPDPRIYHLALERLGVVPQEAVFIDDFQPNIEGAHATGMSAIRFLASAQIHSELSALLNGQK